MQTAHKIGMNTTATMVIGLGESMEERALHLLRVRDTRTSVLLINMIQRVSWPLSLGHSNRTIPT